MTLDPATQTFVNRTASGGAIRTAPRPRTIKVRSAAHGDQEVMINEADFDAEIHQRVDDGPTRLGTRARLATGRPQAAPPSEAQREETGDPGAKTGLAGAAAAKTAGATAPK